MLTFLKRLMDMSPPYRKAPEIPPQRVSRNDPGQPRTRPAGIEPVQPEPKPAQPQEP